MLPVDAFLRRLPIIVDAAQALQLEALVFSADAIEVSLNIIRQARAEHRERIVEATHRVRVGLFVNAWTIVDCVHVARQVLAALDVKSPLALAFREKYASAHALRNNMDHLAGNARNIANAKSRPPIFGALGYVFIPEEKVIEKDGRPSMTGGYIVMLTTGRFAGNATIRAVNPLDRELSAPVSAFRLEAFGETLELQDAERTAPLAPRIGQ